MKRKNRFFLIGLPILIVLLGGLGLAVLASNRPVPRKEEVQSRGALVRVMPTLAASRQVRVHGTGTVEAGQQASIAPQVSGRVVELAPEMVSGGFFKKGELLFAMEEVDYRLAVEQARATVAKAQYALTKEESNARVARQEWERLGLRKEGEPNPLVLFEPQLKNARAELAAAKASLRQAELDLERTKVKAPFDCIIRSEKIDVGQYVRAGNEVATVTGTSRVEIVIPLSLEDMGWLAVPRPGAGQDGSRAVVSQTVGDQQYQWQGRIVRSLGSIDQTSRMAQVVVAVDDPYGLRQPRADQRPSLAVGMFVEVDLEGRKLAEVTAVPRRALRENSTVWVMDQDQRLRIRQVKILRLEQDVALVKQGLASGEQLVLTNITGAADGMELRPLAQESQASTEPRLQPERTHQESLS